MKDSIYNSVVNATSNKLYSKQEVTNAIANAANEVAISRCSNPRPMLVTDRHTSIARRVFVPCGHCYHCLETRTNEWVTRMWHEAAAYGAEKSRVYFVTLTYKGFDHLHEVPENLRNAYWRKDGLNSYGTMQYRPCLCRFEHLAYFVRNFRRLCKEQYEDFDFSYVACSEYGHKWGAPHFHLILFTNHVISWDDVDFAWSFNKGSRKKPNWESIGRIDCVDLVENGTLDGNKENNAKHVFSYVSKYLYKNETPKSARFRLFTKDLRAGLVSFQTLMQVFDDAILARKDLLKTWNAYIYKLKEAVLSDDFNLPKNMKPTKLLPPTLLNKYYYEIDLFLVQNYRCNSGAIIRDALQTLCESDIVRLFRPSVRQSRSHALGKDFIERHVREFSQDGIRLERAAFGSLVVPRYYEKCVANFFAPYEEIKPTPSGGSSSPLFVRKDKVEYFRTYIATGYDITAIAPLVHPYFHFKRTQTPSIIRERMWMRDPFADIDPNIKTDREFDLNEVLRSQYAFRSTLTGCRGFICPNFNGSPRVLWYRYNKAAREYQYVNSDELVLFAFYIVDAYDAYAAYKDAMIQKSVENYAKFDELQKRVYEYFDNKLDFEYFIQIAKTNQDDQRSAMSEDYWRKKECVVAKNCLI